MPAGANDDTGSGFYKNSDEFDQIEDAHDACHKKQQWGKPIMFRPIMQVKRDCTEQQHVQHKHEYTKHK
jgi:hypothetical protein